MGSRIFVAEELETLHYTEKNKSTPLYKAVDIRLEQHRKYLDGCYNRASYFFKPVAKSHVNKTDSFEAYC